MFTEGKEEEEVPALPALACGHLVLVQRWEDHNVSLRSRPRKQDCQRAGAGEFRWQRPGAHISLYSELSDMMVTHVIDLGLSRVNCQPHCPSHGKAGKWQFHQRQHHPWVSSPGPVLLSAPLAQAVCTSGVMCRCSCLFVVGHKRVV